MSVDTRSQVLAKQKQGSTPAFLEKLFDILEDSKSHSHLISWQADGTSFIIKKVNEFSETVLPRYFKHSNIQSYVRQLNIYGFSKTRHDSNHHEFTHRLFQRGRRDLLPFIRRKTQANNRNSTTTQILPEEVLRAVKPTPSGVSSEASQSSNMDDDQFEFIESSPSLQLRVMELEEQVTTLTKLCTELLHQHNFLCEALQSQQERNQTCSKCSFVFNSPSQAVDSNENVGQKRTLETDDQDDPHKRLKRMNSVDIESTPQQEQPQPSDNTTTQPAGSQPNQHPPPLFTKYKINFDISKLLPLITCTYNTSNQPDTHNNDHLTMIGKIPPPFGQQRSRSLDLGGLEAITAAATFLDGRDHKPSSSSNSSNHSSTTNTANMKMNYNNNRSKNKAVMPKAGEPITKAKSFGL